MTKLSHDLDVDLWTLDALWWRCVKPTPPPEPPVEEEDKELKFGLERYLQHFIRDNWDRILFGKNGWILYEEDGECDGFEYDTCEIGCIDLLAQKKDENNRNRWLVIELKKDQSDDATVGQVLRYMGWVKEKLAEGDDQIEGVIISHIDNKKIKSALTFVQNVKHMVYEVNFRLRVTKAEPKEDKSRAARFTWKRGDIQLLERLEKPMED